MITLEVTKEYLDDFELDFIYPKFIEDAIISILRQAHEIKTGIYRHDGEYWEFVEAK